MKILKLVPPIFLVIALFSTGTQISSCVKEVPIHDTITIIKVDTLTIIDSSNCYDLKDGLVAWYNFNKGSLKDSSGNNNHIIFNNATQTTDRKGRANNAYLFNGNGSYMKVANSPTINTVNKISLFALVKINGFYQGKCHGNRIIMKGNADYLTGTYLLTYDDAFYTNGQNCNNISVDTLHQTFYGIATTTPESGNFQYVQKEQWYSLVYTNDGITAKLYINGVLAV